MEEEFEFEEGLGRKGMRILAFISIIFLIFSLVLLIQLRKANSKIKEESKKTQEVESLVKSLQEKNIRLSQQIQATQEDLERILEEVGTTYQWQDVEIEGAKFSYPKKWGTINLVAKNKNIWEFSALNQNIDLIYYFPQHNILAFTERKNFHFNPCATSTPYYEKTLSLIFPGKKILPIYYLAPPPLITTCEEQKKVLPLGVINVNVSPDLKYVYFLVYGLNWSVPKIIRLDNKTNPLEYLIEQFWFDPWEDVYWLEDGKKLAITTFPLFAIPGYFYSPYYSYSESFSPNHISIFFSETEKPEDLKKIFFLDASQYPNQFFGRLYISQKKLFFSIFEGTINPITRKRIILKKTDYFYDFEKKQVSPIGVSPTPTPTPVFEFKFPGL